MLRSETGKGGNRQELPRTGLEGLNLVSGGMESDRQPTKALLCVSVLNSF